MLRENRVQTVPNGRVGSYQGQTESQVEEVRGGVVE
jgi:hypothetical protein